MTLRTLEHTQAAHAMGVMSAELTAVREAIDELVLGLDRDAAIIGRLSIGDCRTRCASDRSATMGHRVAPVSRALASVASATRGRDSSSAGRLVRLVVEFPASGFGLMPQLALHPPLGRGAVIGLAPQHSAASRSIAIEHRGVDPHERNHVGVALPRATLGDRRRRLGAQ